MKAPLAQALDLLILSGSMLSGAPAAAASFGPNSVHSH